MPVISNIENENDIIKYMNKFIFNSRVILRFNYCLSIFIPVHKMLFPDLYCLAQSNVEGAKYMIQFPPDMGKHEF